MTQLPPLNLETLWDILNDRLEDQTVNELVWQHLGYRHTSEGWSAADSPEWQHYPTPPDFIGSRPATVKLTRSIPAANKQLLKDYLGFTGYKVDELVPRRTRRATMVSWLLSYMHDRGMLP